MKVKEYIFGGLLSGLLIVVPVYAVILLILKGANSFVVFVRPVAALFPKWLPAGQLIALMLALVMIFIIGILVRTRIGQIAGHAVEKHFLEKLPGYVSIRGLTARLAGQSLDNSWKPAFAEIEEALVPAFIIEELADGNFTIFVPAVPTPFTGNVYIISANRVHPIDASIGQVVRVLSQWGTGAKDLLATAQVPPSGQASTALSVDNPRKTISQVSF